MCPPSRVRSRGLGVLLPALCLALLVGAPSTGVAGQHARSAPAAASSQATVFRIASLNVLGHDHTRASGNKPGWASGRQRMTWLTNVLRRFEVDVVGFQELERPQFDVLRKRLGAEFGTYPALRWGPRGMRATVAWRKADWRFVSGGWVEVPYFRGEIVRRPVVQLQHRVTGRQIHVATFHNPADARGPAAKWRRRATRIQAELVTRLRAETGWPVFVTGDMNEKDSYFCRVARRTDLRAANGGSWVPGACTPPRPIHIDWVLGSPETVFSDFGAHRGGTIRRSTDHPLVLATATLPAAVEPEPTPAPEPEQPGR